MNLINLKQVIDVKSDGNIFYFFCLCLDNFLVSVMKKIIRTEKIPIKMWLDTLEEGALKQAKNIANLPFSYHYVALMPDCHEGYGMPIGAVLATKGVVVPNAVGVDIGCGICAVKTAITELPKRELELILAGIRRLVPLGFKHHKEKQEDTLMPCVSKLPSGSIVVKEYENARTQIGTLGGGNHFIEVQKGSDGHIWLMLHSGSRNIGHKVAGYYNKLAKQLNERWHTRVNPSADLAFLPAETDEAKHYLAEMQYCIDFAFANRMLIMENIQTVFSDHFGAAFDILRFVNIPHNYASRENHFGTEVMVHRKGATRAEKNESGIIPGSQGTNSFIVRGKGNRESFSSCSHGAGGIMGRKQARRTLDLQKEAADLEKKGILHSLRSQKDLDEAPGAYKNIHEVMRNQSDLVEIEIELSPLAVIKG